MFSKKHNKLLGEILLEKKIITPGQLTQALSLQIKEGGLLGSIVVRLGFASEEEIAQCLSYQYGFAYLPLGNYQINKEAVKSLPYRVAKYYCLIPVDKTENTLTLAMADPLNRDAIEDIKTITPLQLQIFISTTSDILEAIDKYYKE